MWWIEFAISRNLHYIANASLKNRAGLVPGGGSFHMSASVKNPVEKSAECIWRRNSNRSNLDLDLMNAVVNLISLFHVKSSLERELIA